MEYSVHSRHSRISGGRLKSQSLLPWAPADTFFTRFQSAGKNLSLAPRNTRDNLPARKLDCASRPRDHFEKTTLRQTLGRAHAQTKYAPRSRGVRRLDARPRVRIRAAPASSRRRGAYSKSRRITGILRALRDSRRFSCARGELRERERERETYGWEADSRV